MKMKIFIILLRKMVAKKTPRATPIAYQASNLMNLLRKTLVMMILKKKRMLARVLALKRKMMRIAVLVVEKMMKKMSVLVVKRRMRKMLPLNRMLIRMIQTLKKKKTAVVVLALPLV